MPWPGPGLDLPGGVVRLVRALAGPIDVEIEVMAGPDRRPGGSSRAVGPVPAGLDVDGLLVAGPVPFAPAPLDRDTSRWRAVVHLDAGEEVVVTAGLGHPLSPAGAHRLLDDTVTAWRSWIGRLAYAGPYRPAVERAVLALRMLTGGGGAPAGAGTTSLPRRVGSERNHDDRWVDVSVTARAVNALAALGLAEDAEAAEGWLRVMAETAHLPWPAWLDADGQPVPEAEEAPLVGWRGAGPVWAGRSATPWIGLIGPVAAALGAAGSGPGGNRDDPGPLSAALDQLGDALDWQLDRWAEPDAGPWAITEPRQVHTAGRVWLLSGLDRMVAQARAANPLDLRAAAWQAERRPLFAWLEQQASAGGGRLTMHPGTAEADAALLASAWAGPWPPGHPVVAGTVDAVLERLSSGPWLYRYSDRVSDEQAGPDHPDVEASLLGVRALAALSRWEEAHERMEAIVGLLAGGTGLAGETVDPVSGAGYGNFPSSRAAVALLEAAAALELGPR